jgi:hypothetical protein
MDSTGKIFENTMDYPELLQPPLKKDNYGSKLGF